MRAPWVGAVLVVVVVLVTAALLLSQGFFGAGPGQGITISDLVPQDGSIMPANTNVAVSGFIASAGSSIDTQKGGARVFVDGSAVQADFMVGSGAERVGFATSRAFAPGPHVLSAEASNSSGQTGSAQSAFQAGVIPAGSQFVITLEENRTTLYQWKLVEPVDQTVQKVGEPVRAVNPGDGNQVGEGGKSTYTFKALSEGETSIKFNFGPANTQEVARSLEFKVTITK